MYILHEEQERKTDLLLQNIKRDLPQLEELLKNTEDHWGSEDLLYRYYHQSFKVYDIQNFTLALYAALKKISPHVEIFPSSAEAKIYPEKNFCQYFENIIKAGTGKKWIPEHNQRWEAECQPMLEAFFHARYFLEMTVKYGKELDPLDKESVQHYLSSGWAALLELYEIR